MTTDVFVFCSLSFVSSMWTSVIFLKIEDIDDILMTETVSVNVIQEKGN